MSQNKENPQSSALSFDDFKQEVIKDFELACYSREISLLGRKEVLTGKAKFGIFGDGKEIPQIALAKCFAPGDFRTGYYRDQTMMMAAGLLSAEEFYAQLYAQTKMELEPNSAGRQMNAHFATRSLDKEGNWKNLTETPNSAADTSPTASQMPRAVGLGLASKMFRNNPELQKGFEKFSIQGNEVIFATIGDASTSEGPFWEAFNAAGVLQIPVVFSVWDDGYGISVPKEYQTTKGSISEIVSGFHPDGESERGIAVYRVKAWDYPTLCETYTKVVEKVRKTHQPALIHVEECTQPQGHSTSGSHERYKSKERLTWEDEYDGINQMAGWMLANAIISEKEIEEIKSRTKEKAKAAQQAAWKAHEGPIQDEATELINLYQRLLDEDPNLKVLQSEKKFIESNKEPFRRILVVSAKKILRETFGMNLPSREALSQWVNNELDFGAQLYSSHLYSESENSALKVKTIPARFSEDSPRKNGFEILNTFFEGALKRYPELVAFGEDLGKIGDVNQGFAGLQEKFGEHRVFDTGIRENSIIGQGIGLAMRGLRPIAEIQYLDYLIYGLQPLSDDLATLQYRTKGGQKAPMIIRTRGHRLEGIWHTGSPIGMLLGSLRGIYLLVPRNMTQAAGFYNTLLQSDDCGLVIECLNGYRLKETLPENLEEFCLPLGKVERLSEGEDVTVVSYGSTLRVVQQAIAQLEKFGVSVELIDVQSLLPFDLDHDIAKSLNKTNKLVVVDEDVPGGASAFILQKVLEEQDGYHLLDSKPLTITAKAHRSAYASDGDYWSKPNAEEIFEGIYALLNEGDPQRFPIVY